MSSIFAWHYSKLDYCKCKAFLLDSKKDTIILYYYSISSYHDGGVVYILEQTSGCQERYICSIHKLLVKSTFPKYLTKNHSQTPLRYPLRANPLKSSISQLFTPSKITTIPPEIPSTHWKIRLLSNSTENTIYNKEITLQNQLIYNSKITQNTSKINTFTQHKIYKQYNSIEVVFFIIKITSKC